MAISVPKLQAYMEAGLNVLITGPAGTGKTSMLKQASANLGWTMKYYSVSTLDPFADLVGISQPNLSAYENGRRQPSPEVEERIRLALQVRPSMQVSRHRESIRAIVAAHHASTPRVVGSVARGEDQPGSDVDLLVDFTDEAGLLDEVGLRLALTDLLQVSVDVIAADTLREPLRSRLLASPLVAIEEPDMPLMAGLVEKLIHARGLVARPDVIRYIVPRIERSYVGVGRIVDALDEAALARRKPITMAVAREALAAIGISEDDAPKLL